MTDPDVPVLCYQDRLDLMTLIAQYGRAAYDMGLAAHGRDDEGYELSARTRRERFNRVVTILVVNASGER